MSSLNVMKIKGWLHLSSGHWGNSPSNRPEKSSFIATNDLIALAVWWSVKLRIP